MNIERHHSLVEMPAFNMQTLASKSLLNEVGLTNAYDQLAMLTLYDNGLIKDCNKAGGRLLGCAPNDLMWQHVSKLLPQLQAMVLFIDKKLNPRLRYLSRIGQHFEVITCTGIRYVCEIFFREFDQLGTRFLRIIICPIEEK